MKNPVFNEITQICPVVKDIYESVRIYNDVYGIGPWRIYEFDETHIKNWQVDENPQKFRFLAALCNSCNIEIELVQPIDDVGPFAEFLREHGQGLHHVLVKRGNSYEETMALLKERDVRITGSATFASSDMTFLYPDTTKDLGLVMEFVDTDYKPSTKEELGKRKSMLELKAVYPQEEQ